MRWYILAYLDILKWQATLICVLLNCYNKVFIVGIIAASCVVITSTIVHPVHAVGRYMYVSIAETFN